jgi:hypothetical protein
MNESNIGALFLKLEKRVMALENALGMSPDLAELIHPKSAKQYQSVTESTDTGMTDALHKYIYAHYDQGAQASLIMIYANTATPTEIKAMIAPAGYWVMSVLAYYYQMKAQYQATGKWVEPEYSQFDTTDPKVDLNTIIAAMVPQGE